MLINLSNHPNTHWGDMQQQVAIEQFGQVVDYPFPEVPPEWEIEEVGILVAATVTDIIRLYGQCKVLIAGEQSFVVLAVPAFKKVGIACYTATSRRMVELLPDGKKNIQFEFVKFRNL